jgi:hypothetical protein
MICPGASWNPAISAYRILRHQPRQRIPAKTLLEGLTIFSDCPAARKVICLRLTGSSKSRKEKCEEKERGAREQHERLLYCVNVTNTSLDHLLLGTAADVAIIRLRAAAEQMRVGRIILERVAKRAPFWLTESGNHAKFAPRAEASRPAGPNSAGPRVERDSPPAVPG